MQKRNPARRLFTGLVGSPLSAPPIATTISRQLPPQNGTVTKLIEEQIKEKKKRASEQDWLAYLEDEGWEPGDDQPVLVSSRGRHRNRGSVSFQRYQFRLRTTGDRNARWDKGANPAIYDSMSASRQVRELGMDAEGAQTADLYKKSNVVESDFDPDAKAKSGIGVPVSIGNVAQSMPRGFSTGVLSASLAYVDIPREPTPETAWIFSDQRLKFFVSRFVSDDALQAFDMDNPQSLKPFARALKIFVCLWFYFRIGKTSKATISDPDLSRLHLWRSTNALKRYRCRIVKQGLDLFGTPDNPRIEFDDFDPERIDSVYRAVLDIYKSKFESLQ